MSDDQPPWSILRPNSWPSSLKVAGAAGGILAFLATIGVASLWKTGVEPSMDRNADMQTRNFATYLDDLEFVRTEPVFASGRKSGGADASVLLNARVTWQPATADWPAPQRPLVRPEISDRLMRLRTEWIQHPGKFVRVEPDFTILKEAMKFDYWDIEKSGPLAKLTSQSRYVPPPAMPEPDPLELAAFIKLRLIKAIDSGDWVDALSEVRHLARLMYTTESLQLQLASLGVLELERRAYRHYVENNMIDESAWRPIDRNVIRRANRAIWATRGYFRLLTPGAVFEKALLDEHRSPIGFCAAANEAFPIEWSLRPLLSGRWPGEHNMSEAYSRIDRAFERAKRECRVRYLRSLAASGHFDSELPVPKLFMMLPWVRQLFGFKLSGLNFSGFEAYENAAAR